MEWLPGNLPADVEGKNLFLEAGTMRMKRFVQKVTA